jgi:hypothetical protein
VFFYDIQHSALGRSSTLHTVPAGILPSVIHTHRDCNDESEDRECDVQCDAFDEPRLLAVREGEASEDREALANAVKEAERCSALALASGVCGLLVRNCTALQYLGLLLDCQDMMRGMLLGKFTLVDE